MSGYALISSARPSNWLLEGGLWTPRYQDVNFQTGGFELDHPHGDGTFAGVRVPAPGLWYVHLVYQFAVDTYAGETPAGTTPVWMIPNIIDGAAAGVAGAAAAHTNGSGEFPLARNGSPNQWSGVFLAAPGVDSIVVAFNGSPEFWTADWRQWLASPWLSTSGEAQMAVMQVPGGALGNIALDALASQGVFRV